MNLNVLVSCMHEKDTSIIARSNIQSDVIVVNQCDKDSVEEFDFINKHGKTCHAKFINTTERGLSRSRNRAILNAWGDICLIADDDEVFSNDYPDVVYKAYNDINADVIAFGFHYSNRERNNFTKRTKIGWFNFLKISSVQISFKRKIINAYNIRFAENMGSGTGNGGGEENKLISDCLRNKLSIIAEPSDIAVIDYDTKNSKWFNGFDKNYFVKNGWSIKQSIGTLGGLAFSFIHCTRRASMIKTDICPVKAFFYMVKGVFSSF